MLLNKVARHRGHFLYFMVDKAVIFSDLPLKLIDLLKNADLALKFSVLILMTSLTLCFWWPF